MAPMGMHPMDSARMEAFMQRQVTARLGLVDGDRPYVVPLSVMYHKGMCHIHLVAGEGKKARLIELNSSVCLEMDEYTTNHLWRGSVLVRGRAERVTDHAELVDFLVAFAQRFPDFAPGGMGRHPAVARAALTLSIPMMADKVTVYRVVPEEVTGFWADDRPGTLGFDDLPDSRR
jgi:uncharacterized protein